jgi:peptidyl-prolyl cis-trans isomerase C
MHRYDLLILPLILACSAPGPEKDTIAKVGDSALSTSKLEAILPYGSDAEARQRVLKNWVGRELLYQEALARKLHESVRLQEQLERTRRDLLLAALLDDEFGREEVHVEEDEIHQHYQAHEDDFLREEDEIHVRHILLASKREANTRRAALQRGADFAEVARDFSEDVDTRDRGGDLGLFSQEDEPVLWKACEDLKLNSVSRSIHTEYGYHLLEVLERPEAGTLRPLEQVRAQIVETIVWQQHRQRMDQLVESLKKTKDWAIISP